MRKLPTLTAIGAVICLVAAPPSSAAGETSGHAVEEEIEEYLLRPCSLISAWAVGFSTAEAQAIIDRLTPSQQKEREIVRLEAKIATLRAMQ